MSANIDSGKSYNIDDPDVVWVSSGNGGRIYIEGNQSVFKVNKFDMAAKGLSKISVIKQLLDVGVVVFLDEPMFVGILDQYHTKEELETLLAGEVFISKTDNIVDRIWREPST